VNVKVVFPPDVLARKGAKMDLVEYDLVRVADAPETDDESQEGDERRCAP
jgi:hypothetical protein